MSSGSKLIHFTAVRRSTPSSWIDRIITRLPRASPSTSTIRFRYRASEPRNGLRFLLLRGETAGMDVTTIYDGHIITMRTLSLKLPTFSL
ncbi:hypothetical protein [Caballeronia catudaia]|uniref:hypothetical protein n=1 Tax=Caballeronia catudaia TaxID=1777136 RepID=UPI0013589E5B|nr:hypothetical protein [Caballeronia catudaia]